MDEAARWRLITRATPHLRFVEGRVLLFIHLQAVEMGAADPIICIGEFVEAAGASRRMVFYALNSLRERGLVTSQRVRIAERMRPRRYRIEWSALGQHAREGTL